MFGLHGSDNIGTLMNAKTNIFNRTTINVIIMVGFNKCENREENIDFEKHHGPQIQVLKARRN